MHLPSYLKLELWFFIIAILCRMLVANTVFMSRREKPLVHHLMDSVVSSFMGLQAQINLQCETSRIRHKEVMTEVSEWVSNKHPQHTTATSYSISETVKEANNYLSSHAEWEYMGEEREVKVWKLKPSTIKLKWDDKQWPCVKSTTIIKKDPKSLMKYLLDSSKVPEYNKHCAGRTDVEHVSKKCKIVWNRTIIPLMIKSYDFSTLMHHYLSRNDIHLISKAVEHPLIPVHKDYSRSELIMGLNILSPIKKDGCDSTHITCISHVKYGGFSPPSVIKKSIFRGTVKYLHNLKEKVDAG